MRADCFAFIHSILDVYCNTVNVLKLPWVDLQFVIVIFPDHLFLFDIICLMFLSDMTVEIEREQNVQMKRKKYIANQQHDHSLRSIDLSHLP